MKRLVVQISKFSATLDNLVSSNRLSSEDFWKFEELLVSNPDVGDVVQGTGGLRKTRLKSASKGKSGGFRVCYCDIPEKEKIFLIAIFPKNIQENLSQEEKKFIKKLIDDLKTE